MPKYEKVTILRPWAWRWQGGLLIYPQTLLESLKDVEILRFKDVDIGAKTFRELLKNMECGYHVLITKVVLETNGDGAPPPFFGPGLQFEVGPVIVRKGKNGDERVTRRTARDKPYYSKFRVAHGTWLPQKPAASRKIAKLEPRLIPPPKSHRNGVTVS